MADNIVGGLFGVDPQQLAQSRQATDMQNAYKIAQLDPMQRAQMAIYQGGAGLGRAASGLLGGDPEMEKVSKIKQLSSQFDLTSPQGLRDFARSLQPIAPQEAMMAAKRADEIDKGIGDRALSARKLQTEGNKLEWIGVDGQPDMKQQAVVDVATGNVIKRVGDPVSVVTSRSSSTVNLPAGESEFIKQLGKNDANTVTTAMTNRSNALATVQTLEKLEGLDNQQLYSGTAADSRAAVGNFLNTIGLASKDDVGRISNSQQYQKLAKDVIFQTLGGKLGAGFSNADREFVEALIPKLETSADARKQLINYMKDKYTLIASESSRLENYARQNKGLGGFDYKLPRDTIAPPSNNLGNYSREEILAEAARRKTNK
jgi:hypothetical protein